MDAPLSFHTPGGEPLVARAVDLAFDTFDGHVTECRLTFDLAPETYRSVASSGLFHLAPDNRGPGSADFAPTGEVRVEARLEASLVQEMVGRGPAVREAAEALALASDVRPSTALLLTENWYALHVTTEQPQDVDPEGTLRVGYSTIFAGSGYRPAGQQLRLPMLALAIAVLDSRGTRWAETADPEVVECEVAGENGNWTAYVVAREAEQRCSVYTQPDWYTPEPARAAMAEVTARINYGLSNGNFELDFSDGEVRFKTAIDVSGDRLTTALLSTIIETNFVTMDTYLPALEAVRDGRLSPAQAVRLVEG